MSTNMDVDDLRKEQGKPPLKTSRLADDLPKLMALPARSIRRTGRGVRPDNTQMNRLEREYSEHLERRKQAGEIYDWKFHAVTLKIADPPNAKCATWSPDFAVWTNEMVLEFHDTKGFMEDHAQVRIKVAASQFPHPVFIVTKKAKKNGGGFEIKEL